MAGSAEELAASARHITYVWLQAGASWSDHTATDFHDRYWTELEREAREIAEAAAALEEVLATARRAVEL